MAYDEFLKFLFPAIGIIAPIIIMMLTRGFESGKRSVVNETNLMRMMEEVPHLREKTSDLYKQIGEIKTDIAVIDDRLKRFVGQ